MGECLARAVNARRGAARSFVRARWWCRDGDGHGRGKGEKPDDEQKQIAVSLGAMTFMESHGCIGMPAGWRRTDIVAP